MSNHPADPLQGERRGVCSSGFKLQQHVISGPQARKRGGAVKIIGDQRKVRFDGSDAADLAKPGICVRRKRPFELGCHPDFRLIHSETTTVMMCRSEIDTRIARKTGFTVLWRNHFCPSTAPGQPPSIARKCSVFSGVRDVSRFAFHLSQPNAANATGLIRLTAAKYSSHQSPGLKLSVCKLISSSTGQATIHKTAGST